MTFRVKWRFEKKAEIETYFIQNIREVRTIKSYFIRDMQQVQLSMRNSYDSSTDWREHGGVNVLRKEGGDE